MSVCAPQNRHNDIHSTAIRTFLTVDPVVTNLANYHICVVVEALL